MTRDEVLRKLRESRAEFDSLVAHVPIARLPVVPEGHHHSPKDIVAHVTAYDELVVKRLQAAHEGVTTAFDRDREGWEQFNQRIWAEAASLEPQHVLEHAGRVFHELLGEVGQLNDAELVSNVGIVTSIDSRWLEGRTLVELIEIDCFGHYPMHYEALKDAVTQSGG